MFKWGLGKKETWIWTHWNAETDKKDREYFKGYPIVEQKESWESLINREQINKRWMEKLNALRRKYKVSDDRYDWQIWNEIVDFIANIWWTGWNKLFWFYWMIKWLKTDKNTWPNWRKHIDVKSIKANEDLEEEINILVTNEDKKQKIEWRFHQNDWEIFWVDCNWEAWHIWVADQLHEMHRICSMKSIKESALVLAHNALSTNESIKLLKQTELNRMENNKMFAKYIKNNIINSYREEIESINQKINKEMTDSFENFLEKINSNNEENKLNEELLNQFIESEDILKMTSSFKATTGLEAWQNNMKDILNESKNSDKGNIIESECPLKFKFMVEANKIKNLK